MPPSQPSSQAPTGPPSVVLSFGAGEHHTADETAIPPGFARRVSNFDISDSGVLDTRPEFELAPTLEGGHSMWTSNDHSVTLVFVGTELCRLLGGVVLQHLGAYISGRGRVWYEEINGDVWFSNGADGGVLRATGAVESFGTTPAVPPRAANTEVIDQREYLSPMPFCRYLAFYAGRLWGVQGDTIFFSQPLNYQQHDRRYDFIRAPGYVTAFGRVSDGLYVSTVQEVFFIRGTDPAKMELVKCSDSAAVLDSQVYLPFDSVDTEALAVNGSQYQVSNAFAWLSRHGLCIGIPSGVVRNLTADRIRLPLYSRASSALLARNGFYQVVSVVDSIGPDGRGHARDSAITTS